MFNRSKSPVNEPLPPLPEPTDRVTIPDTPAPAPAVSTSSSPSSRAAAPARGLSILAQDVTFVGDLKGNGDVQVDGNLKGELRVGRVIIGEAGTVEGNIAAEYVEVRGRVVGSVSAKQTKLVSTAYLEGDITSEQLSIDVGAYFQGRVAQGRRDVAAAAPAAAPQPVAPTPVSTPVTQAVPASSNASDPGLGIPPAPAEAGQH